MEKVKKILKEWVLKDIKVIQYGDDEDEDKKIIVSSEEFGVSKEYTEHFQGRKFGLRQAYDFLEIEPTEEEKKSKFFWLVGNTYSKGFGRPKEYSDPYELEYDLIQYFEWCQGEYEDREVRTEITKTSGKGKDATTTTEVSYTVRRECIRAPEPPSITGLCMHLKFSSKDTLYNYRKDEDNGFSDAIKRALLQVEHKYELGLWNDKPTGVIFALKNMGWKDKTEVENTIIAEQPLFGSDFGKEV